MLQPVRLLARVSLGFYLFSTLSEIGSHLSRMFPTETLLAGANLHDSYYVAGLGVFELLMLLTGIPASVLFLIWKYRAATSARANNPSVMTVSPAMAVGSYFIPFANLVIPYQAMVGISRSSTGASRGVVLWWTGHLGCLASTIAIVAMQHADQPLQPTRLEHFYIIWSSATFLVSWPLVMGITRAQSAKIPQ